MVVALPEWGLTKPENEWVSHQVGPIVSPQVWEQYDQLIEQTYKTQLLQMQQSEVQKNQLETTRVYQPYQIGTSAALVGAYSSNFAGTARAMVGARVSA